MAKSASGSERPRRTKEHVNASKSHNYVERFFIYKGHTVERPTADYGYDIRVTTYDAEGYIENGDIRIQLKASDSLAYIEGAEAIAYRISIQHYNLWMSEPMPVFLVLYDASRDRAFWVYIQSYFRTAARRPRATARTLTIRVPTANEFTDTTVDYARDRKAAALTSLRGKVPHHE